MKKFLLPLLYFLSYSQLVNAQYQKFCFYADKMGSPLKLTIASTSSTIDSVFCSQLATATFLYIDSLNHILSDYDKTSELSWINEHAGKGVQPISPILEEILVIAQKAYYQTKGAYNIAISSSSCSKQSCF